MLISRRSQELGLSYCTLWRILHLDLQLHPYKAQLRQQLKPVDHLQHRTYMEWVLEQQAVNGNFLNENLFSYRYVNEQNCRIWGSEHSQAIKKRPLYPEKVTIWCALYSEVMIGPYFYENEDGTIVTVNSERYGHTITDFFTCYRSIRLG